MGIGSSNGVESIIHTIQDHLERHPHHTLLSLDYVNGFNSMFRHVMLRQLYDQPGLAVLWRLSDFCYGDASRLHFFDRSELVSSFESQRGARQGCVLGSLLFCLGLQPALLDATRDLPDIALRAYVDDLSVAGPIDQIAQVLARLRDSLLLSVSRPLIPNPLYFGPSPPTLLPPPSLRLLLLPACRFFVEWPLC